MADLPISQLPKADSLEKEDQFAIVQDGTTKKVEYGTFKPKDLSELVATTTIDDDDYITIYDDGELKKAKVGDLLSGVSDAEGEIGDIQTDIDDINDEIDNIKTAIDKEVEQSTDYTTDTSTVTSKIEKINLSTGSTSTDSKALPVASETQAGVMNTATFKAVAENSENIDLILNGTVMVTGLSSSPSQDGLTDAWKQASGKTKLINGAKIHDSDNDKDWTYYANTSEWVPQASGGSTVTVSQWTNTAAGIAKGSEKDGQVFAEADGTGSVNGWDNTQTAIKNNADAIKNVQDDIGDIQDVLERLDTGDGVGSGGGGGGDDDDDVPTSLSELKAALDAGKEIPVGTEIPDTIDGQSHPLIVVQNLNSSNNSLYDGAEGVILQRKYAKGTTGAGLAGYIYPDGDVKTYLDSIYPNSCSAELKAMLSNIKVKYTDDGVSFGYMTGKWFAPCVEEVYGNAASPYPGMGKEGIAFEYWKQKTGLSSPSNAANAGRVVLDGEGGTATQYWLRDQQRSVSADMMATVATDGSIVLASGTVARKVCPCCFIARSNQHTGGGGN